MFVSVFAVTLFILLAAMIMDFGLFYYKQARLQNAGDAAATAVAASIDATDKDLDAIAKQYLKKNGIDYSDDDMTIKIQKKGMLDEATANDDDYITTGYIKLTVKIKTGTLFGPILNMDSLMLHSTSFVKVNANYASGMPRALNYTLFAGSTTGTTASPAIKINGRTGTVTNILTSGFESMLNGLNEKVVQPLIGFFGGTPNYTDLVHINLSEAITNGDIHSNSNMNIGAQVVNVSRIKDGNLQEVKTDSDGNPVAARDDDGNIIYQKDSDGNFIYRTKTDSDGNPVTKKDSNGNIIYSTTPATDDNGNPVYKVDENGNYIPKKDSDGNPLKDENGNVIYEQEYEPEYEQEKVPVYVYENYTQSTSDENSANDYGQVTYTAVKDINFTNTSWNPNSVHLYVQNQQKIETTQTALAILNMIDYGQNETLASIQSKYETAANDFFEAKGSVITDAQKAKIKAQKDNLVLNGNTITLAGQESIVYDINRNDSKAMLEKAYEDSHTSSTSTEIDGITIEKSKLFDQIANGEDKLYSNETTKTLLFQNVADTLDSGGVGYQIEVGKGDNKYTVVVSGDKVNRDYQKTGSDTVGSDYDGSVTAIGAKYAMYKTFQQRLGDNGFITTPNLKPYFIRMTNKSVANSVKGRGDYTTAEAKVTVRKAVADLGDQLQDILDETSYEDNTYSNFSDVVKKDTSPFFTQNMASKSSGLTKLEGDDHTKFNGYSLYNSKDILKTPSEFINEYKKSYKFADVANKNYYDKEISGKYADDGVQAKKNTIKKGSISVSEKYNSVKDDATYKRLSSESLPNKTDVFLGDSTAYTKRTEFNNYVDSAYSVKPDVKTATAQAKTSSFNIDDYMPTIDVTNHTVTAKSVAKFADGSDTISGLELATELGDFNWLNSKCLLNNRWITNTIYRSHWVRLSNDNSKAVVQGNLTVNDDLDIGPDSNGSDNNTKSTLIVTGNLYADTLKIRKNSVVFVYGDLQCKELEMYEGARLYVKGNINVTKSDGMSYEGKSNQKIYCGGNATLPNNLDSTREYKIGGNLDTHEIYLTYTNYYFGGGVKCTKFTEEYSNMNIVLDYFQCTGDTTLNNTSKLYVNGNATTVKIYMYNNSAIYVCGNMNSTNEQCLWQGSGIVVNGTASLGTLKFYDSSILNVTGGLTVTGDLYLESTSLVNVNNAIVCNNIVNLSGTGKIYANASFTAQRLTGSTANNIIQANGIKFTQSSNKDKQFAIHCRLESWGDIEFNCYVSIESDCVAVAKGKVIANGIYMTGGTTGLDINGIVYSVGDVITAYPFSINSGKLYCAGNLNAATGTVGYDEAILIKGTSELYVTGYVSSGTGRRIKLYSVDGGQGSTVSIFGLNGVTDSGYVNAFSSNINEFVNDQPNSHIYLGDGTIDQTATNSYLSFSKQFSNSGSLYLYGSLNINSNNFVGNNGGLTIIGGNMTMSSGAITLSDSHSLIVLGNLASNSSINLSSSKIYVVGRLETYNFGGASVILNDNSYMIIGEEASQNACNSIIINGGSKFWSLAPVWTTNVVSVESSSADNLSEFFSNGKHTITQTNTSKKTDVEINGLYIAENSGDMTLNSLYIKQYGRLEYDGGLTILSSIKVDDGGYLYVSGTVELGADSILGVAYKAKLSNGGKMYLMGGLDIVNSGGSTNDPEIAFTSDNADTFIAANSAKTLTLNGYLHTQGIVNIENSVIINGNKKIDGMPNRGTGFAVLSGSVNVSGSVNIFAGNALFVKSASLGISGDVNMASVVYNYGKLYILGNLNVDWSQTKYITDRDSDYDMRTGYSLKNGQTIGTVDAYLYIGGTNDLKFYGFVQNFGEIYSNAGMRVRGWCNMPGSAIMCDTAFINFKNAKAHFGGGVDLNSNAFYNGENSVFDCSGDYTYGIVTINLGSFAASGNVEMNKINVDQSSYNNASWRNSKSMSFMNGFETIDGVEYKDATVYIGGNLKLGSNELSGNAGSYFTMGKTYIGGDLLDYCNRANAYYATAIWAFNFSNTFIGGDCFGGGGIATGNNSIFMVGGDYQSKRSTKINIEMFTYSAVDATYYSFCDDNHSYRNEFNKDPNKYRSAYFYVGGNMLCNTVGASLWTASMSKVPENNTRDTDIYSNSNVYVGGSMYVNSKLYMKQNVTLAVAGDKKLNDTSTLKGILEAVSDGTIKANIQNLLNNDDYKLFVFQCLDENICSKIIVNGSMLVRDTAKMRDMTKNYIAGNFKGNDYVEIGKSLLDLDEDRSQAAVADGKFWTKGDSLKTYTFANAGYTYVGGNFESGKYTKLYASTTLRVRDDYVSNKYLTLRHDAKIYVGKKLKALTSIEGGSYSEFHVGGSLQASTSWIKLRDCTTVAVGGNFTALSYIELGKAGDYTRTIDGNKVTETTAHGVTEGEEPKYDTDKDGGDGSTSEGDKIGGSTDAGKDTTDTAQSNDSLNAQKELQEDSSDTANGGTFFIGQSLVSYTGQIFEYAYSQVAVGNYVFTPKYLTLRHNADMWVMPETFKNATYMHKPYVSGSDGSLWGDIVDALKKFNYTIKDTFSAKQGSIYTLGSLTLNKNASLMGTYDCLVQGQCVFRQDALVYLGHDFTCTASSFNLDISSLKGETSYAGFDSRGTSSQDGETSFPVLLYADNDINIYTTIDIRLTYLIANKGDVNLFNVYSNTENAAYNAKQLPNAICSYQGDINYFAGYGKLGALFYAPNGNLDFDGWYQEIWGCGIANTIEDNAYYFNLHRFENWRTIDLHLAESGSIFLVSEDEYNNASDDVFNYDLDDSNTDMASGGASVFFPRDVLDNIPNENY